MSVARGTWFVEPGDESPVSYGELLTKLNHERQQHRRELRPESTRAALAAIAGALVVGGDTILFDTAFSDGEIRSLGFDPSRLGETTALPTSTEITLARLQKSAAGTSSARLGLFTSGSTGLPKLVWQPIANLARGVRASPRQAEAVWAFAYNPTHIAGIQVYLQALANACPLVNLFGLKRLEILEAIERYGITHLSATPSFYRLLLPVERFFDKVRSVTLGGESSDASLLERLRPMFPVGRFHNIYASTEAGTLLNSQGDCFSILPGLLGKVRIEDQTLRVHRSLLGEFEHQGGTEWYDTGDVVEVVTAAPLQFRIVARQRDWVNVGGNKVNPREVEAALENHPDVVRAMVYARKNSVMGHLLCAEVVPCAGQTVTEVALREFAATRLQPFKIPRMIRFVKELAATRTGKLLRS